MDMEKLVFVFSLFIAVLFSLVSCNLENNSTTWFDTLPKKVRNSILWEGNCEEGNFWDWEYDDKDNAGGGIFNTGGDEGSAYISEFYVHSGKYGAAAAITNAYRGKNGNRAVRLMRWTDAAWADDGDYFPTEAYYSTWMYFPANYNPNKDDPWDLGDGGWWNVFLYKRQSTANSGRAMDTCRGLL